ncbi:Uncharacterised protein [Mycobacteroides abscessus subsp. abscessus]|uniref:hypothetical protein n=1 Tax=Mycobacteroides abscessus TaxID=36809 RepID=UPI000925AF73|nr:hypothetical protein [Mycobacteroides abscessus]SHS11428.1 Uncharacterised protein [Mycobacteroides abscessus subsp. abscessus]SHS11454.1 Uncharacterised protein [Mycobacteroides abscessus subsp. abscessus]SHT23085.1 Uncharacterised protein [Mycobacteroides abscessus subsp. abscessus]SHW59443.1 Uncharacterised protein [Mycobacteroides abscessus subsp. abscessus]SIB53354.1 Uncharacterised protein [Mycobacteroides abscessus subsp. abscessus]
MGALVISGHTDGGKRIDTANTVSAAQWAWQQVQSGAVVVITNTKERHENQ